MTNSKYHIKSYFTFSRAQRRGMLVLFCILLLLIISSLSLPFFIRQKNDDFKSYTTEIERFLASRQASKPEKRPLSPFPFDPNMLDKKQWTDMGLSPRQAEMIIKYRKAGGRFYNKKDLKKIYAISEAEYAILEPFIRISNPQKEKPLRKSVINPFPFDPNTVEEKDLCKLGLSKAQVSNILSYRDAGGIFRVKKDLMKLYSLDTSDYQILEKFILLPSTDTLSRKENLPRQPELSVEVNRADTTQLKKLPGIGSAFARRIIKYRELLGGYNTKSQLLEVYGMDTMRYSRIAEHVSIDASAIRKINLNTASFKEILKHPYLEFYIVKSIFNYKDAHGSFDTIAELREVEMVYEALYDKVAPYFYVSNKQE